MEKSTSIAFVLIMCKPEFILDIAWQLDEIDTVKETTLIGGPYQIIVELESEKLDHIRDAIRWKIRKIPTIASTLTLVEYMS